MIPRSERRVFIKPLTAQEEAWVAEHEAAVSRLPADVQEAWKLYLADANRGIYPFGFAVHFPAQWRWMEMHRACL